MRRGVANPSVDSSLDFDFPGLRIGVAENDEGPTGCTVFYFPERVTAAVDIRGGSPCTSFTDQLRFGDGILDAICFAGGSMYGLEAACGVAEAIRVHRGQSAEWGDIALVSGAVIYDFFEGSSAIFPDKRLGEAAFHASKEGEFPLGRRGAGRNATFGKIHGRENAALGGQIGAYGQIGPTRVAVFTVINSLGNLAFNGKLTAQSTSDVPTARKQSGTNTTLTLVVTNEQLPSYSLRQLAVQVHAGIGAIICPYSTVHDGDVLYAVTTQKVANSDINDVDIGLFAEEIIHQGLRAAFSEVDSSS